MKSEQKTTSLAIEGTIDGRAFTTPKGKPLLYFFPTMDFYSEEVETSYKTGERYTLRENNAKLAELINVWSKQGKITVEVIK